MRAVAVLPVVLFHAKFPGFAGGFVGVDVFFVISGYLITALILKDLSTGKFSIFAFYERRVRRIMPALLTVILVCVPLAYAWMLPKQLEQFGASVVSVLTFWSNILFWMQSGYFGEAADLKPLLHTWSLAVEEQFYLFFPLILVLIWRPGQRLAIALLLLFAICSLALAQAHPEWASFFMTPGRIWELLAGAFAALWLRRKERFGGVGGEVLSLVGVVALVVAIATYTEATLYPSIFTALPVLTALAIILTRAETIVGRILSLPPLVLVGLASYSIYLWHQPVFAFARLRSLSALDPWQLGALVVVSIALGFASYRFIERPFRDRGKISARVLWISTGAGAGLLLASGSYLYVAQGVPSRLEALPGHNAVRTVQPDMATCAWTPPFEELPYLTTCSFGAAEATRSFVIFGDSHSEIYGPALQEVFTADGVGGIYIRNAYCGTFPGIHNDGPAMNLDVARTCPAVLSELYGWLKQRNLIGAIIANRWTYRLFPTSGQIDELIFDNHEGGVESAGYVESYALTPDGQPTHEAEARRQAVQQFISGFDREFDIPIAIVYPVPEAGWNITQRNLKSLLFQGYAEEQISTSSSRFMERNRFAIDLLDGLVSPNIRRVKPSAVLCDTFLPGRCAVQIEGTPFYHDDDHLSAYGVDLVIGDLLKALGF